MIYFVERSDGRVKIGFLRSLYSVDLDLHGGRLIALVEGSAQRLGAIRSLFSKIPREDGWYLKTAGIILFIAEHSIERSPDPELREVWAGIANGSSVARHQFAGE